MAISKDYRKELSNFQSPFSVTEKSSTRRNSSKNKLLLQDRNIPSQKTPVSIAIKNHIRSIKFGTGLGKTFGATENFIDFSRCSGYIAQNYIRTDFKNFANLFFSVPTKELFSFSNKHLDDFQKYGITPLSVLSRTDYADANMKVWATRSHVKMIDRLSDFVNSLRVIYNLAKATDNKRYLKQIYFMQQECRVMRDKLSQMRRYEAQLQEFNSTTSTEYKNIKGARDKALFVYETSKRNLVYAILTNSEEVKSIAKEKSSNETEYEGNDNLFNDLQEKIEIDELDEYDYLISNDNSEGLPSYSDIDVFNEIFRSAYLKDEFDELIYNKFIKNSNDFKKSFATFKKDFLRIYAPLDYSTFTPSVVMLTHDKLLTSPVMYLYNDGEWSQSKGHRTFFQLLGGKERYDEMIPYIQNHQQKAFLEKTLFKNINIDSSGKLKKKDYTNSYIKRDIENFIVIDECNVLFDKMLDNSLRLILKEVSITDLVINARSLFSSLNDIENDPYFDINNPPNDIFYYEIKSFCHELTDFYNAHKHSDDHYDFDIATTLEQVASFNNILHTLPTDTDVVINLAKNSFSVSPKLFINKQSLLKLRVGKRFNETYITTDTSKPTLSLYNYYILVLSILYAAKTYIDKTERKTKYKEQAKQIGGKDLRNESTKYIGGMYNTSTSDGYDTSKMRNLSPLAKIMRSVDKIEIYEKFLNSNTDIDTTNDVDTWFCYVQSFMIFGLIPTDFNKDMKDNSYRKTFYDLQIYRRDALPELEILKCLVNTEAKNYLYLMSATSGQEGFTYGQFNNAVIKKYADMFNVPLYEAEYDTTFNIDYQALSNEYLDYRKTNRDCNIIIYDKSENFFQREMSNEIICKMQNLYESISKDKDTSYALNKRQNRQHMHTTMLNSMFYFMIKHETYLSMSINQVTFKAIKRFMTTVFENNYFHREYRTRLIQHIKEVVTSYGELKKPFVFKHHNTNIGNFYLPLLNDYIWSQYGELTDNRDNLDDDEFQLENDSNIIFERLIKSFKKGVLINIIDFVDINKKFTGEQSNIVKINRLVLFNNELRAWQGDLSEYFVVRHTFIDGIGECIIKTGFLSYFKAVDTGVNLSINNYSDYTHDNTPIREDIKNLVVTGFDFYNTLYSPDGGVKNILLQGQVFLRSLGNVSHSEDDFVKIEQLEDYMSSSDFAKKIKQEVTNDQCNGMMQKVGRVERNDEKINKYGLIFANNIFIDKDAFDMLSMAVMNKHKLDENLNPTYNKNSYAFQSYNNRILYEKVVDNIKHNILTDSARLELETLTLEASERINQFCNVFLKELTSGIRKRNDRDYAQFDLRYRSISIIINPKKYIDDLLSTSLAKKDPYIREVIKSMLIQKSAFTTNNIDLFVFRDGMNVGLTDFLGNKDHNRSCTKEGYFIQPVKASEEYAYGYKDELIEVVRFYNNIAKQSYGEYIIHPAMFHMVVANIGEAVHRCFRKHVLVDYHFIESTDVIEKLGYQMHEQSDDWVLADDWIAIDVKTMSHFENRKATIELFAKQDRKIKNKFNITEKAFDILFKDHSKFSLLNLNVRVPLNNNQYSLNTERVKNIDVLGKNIELTIKNINMFTRVLDNPYDERDYPYVTFSNELLEAFNLK